MGRATSVSMAAALMAAPIAGQTVREPAPPVKAPVSAAHAEQDVVVEALRDVDDSAPATRKTLNSSKTGSQIFSRQSSAIADQFARCSVKADMGHTELLHLALDSVMNSVRQDLAQRRFIEGYAGCASNSDSASHWGLTSMTGLKNSRSSNQGTTDPSTNFANTSSDLAEDDPQYYYDRGALFVRAVQVFASATELTEEKMDARAVQARFVAREEPLARLREPQDRQYLGAAICIVHHQPALAYRLVVRDLPASDREDIAGAIVNRSRACFGGARKVYFDVAQFRFWVADALYRWVVAVRGVDSLIPPWDKDGQP